MEIIKPYNDKNAVKIIAFAFSFLKRLTLEEIDIVIEKINANKFLNSEFPKKDKQQEISMTIGPDGIPKPSQSLGGLVCSKIENSKNTWSLEINKDLLIITCRDYTRWQNISEASFKYIAEIFNMIPDSDSRIANVALEYLDEFVVVDSKKDWKKLLFKESEYIPQHIYTLDDYWHINHGFFFNISNIKEKTLNTVATNFFADEMDDMKEKINIRMQHKVIYNSAVPYNNSEIMEIFNNLHVYSKEVFEKIINDSILETFERGKL